jgi:heme/copper-type cytochrome/quinol oxidase subunit 1
VAAQVFFMMSTMLIAVPTGVKVFNWTATMWRGSLSFEPPMLFAMSFLFLFTIGGFSGVMLAIVPVDFQYNQTYFVVAHFHYVLVPGAIFAIMAAVYYWLPKWTGHMYNMGWPSGISGCRRFSSTCCSSRSTFLGWRACRAASRTMPCSSPTGTWCPPSAASASACRRSCSRS